MDNAMQSLYRAIEHASPIWQQAVYHLGWSHAALTSAYGAAAWLCFLNVQIEEDALERCALWWAATVLMCLLGGNAVLQVDFLVTQTLRALSRLQGWYEQRRMFQYLAIFLIALVVLAALNSKIWLSQRRRPCAQPYTGAVSVGLLALVLLFTLRMVSAHGTDAVLNVRLLGVSIGRLFELVGLVWVMWGALCSLRRLFANPKPRLQAIDRHV